MRSSRSAPTILYVLLLAASIVFGWCNLFVSLIMTSNLFKQVAVASSWKQGGDSLQVNMTTQCNLTSKKEVNDQIADFVVEWLRLASSRCWHPEKTCLGSEMYEIWKMLNLHLFEPPPPKTKIIYNASDRIVCSRLWWASTGQDALHRSLSFWLQVCKFRASSILMYSSKPWIRIKNSDTRIHVLKKIINTAKAVDILNLPHITGRIQSANSGMKLLYRATI